MSDLNQFMVEGNLGKDATITEKDNGSLSVFFTIAQNESYKDRNGEYQQITNWFPISLTTKSEKFAALFTKGRRVRCRIKIRTQRDDSGDTPQTKFYFNAQDVEPLPTRKRDDDDGDEQPRRSSSSRPKATAQQNTRNRRPARREEPEDYDDAQDDSEESLW